MMKQALRWLFVLTVLAVSCSKQKPPQPERWTSSIPLEPGDIATPEGRATWSNAMDALCGKIEDQEAKVASMRETVTRETNSSLAASLAQEEQILKALRRIREKERARLEKQ